ncbi:MAG TPA: hypothetical protein VMT64_14105 [Candidatus Binataceae bacterium]|nr:hypothetical protein [Candidatus Binataceae bacterium]
MSRLTLTIVLVAIISGGALLVDAAAAKQAKPKRASASLKLTLASPSPGACPTPGVTTYETTCPDTDTCSCVTFTGSSTGGFGKGNVAGEFTLDNTNTTPEGNCTPFFGSLVLTETKTAAVTTLDVNGGLCKATTPETGQTLGGGFDFDPASTASTGSGSITGTVDSAGSAKLKLVGAIAPVAAASPTETPAPTAAPTTAPTTAPTATPTP